MKSLKSALHIIFHGSLPARGVWIEIALAANATTVKDVTPRKGSVD